MLQLFLLATLAAQPTPTNPKGDMRGLFAVEDYPSLAVRQGLSGSVRARLTVSPEGRVTACEAIESSGHPVLDDRTCAVLMERARFDPAMNGEGDAVEGSYTTPKITWQLQASEPLPDSVESPLQRMSIQPGQLPPAMLTKMAFEYDRSGMIEGCARLDPDPSGALDSLDCGPLTFWGREVWSLLQSMGESTDGTIVSWIDTQRDMVDRTQYAPFDALGGETLVNTAVRFDFDEDGIQNCEWMAQKGRQVFGAEDCATFAEMGRHQYCLLWTFDKPCNGKSTIHRREIRRVSRVEGLIGEDLQ